MAIWRWRFCSVNGPKRRAASGESVKFTWYWPGLLVLRFSTALRRSRPVTMGARFKTYQLSPVSTPPVELRNSFPEAGHHNEPPAQLIQKDREPDPRPISVPTDPPPG